MIYTTTFLVPKGIDIERYIFNKINHDVDEPDHILLRWAVVNVKDKYVTVDASILENEGNWQPYKEIPFTPNNKFVVVNIVPTGVRAEIGGYIADATPVTNVLAQIADKVIVHPNVVNGSFINYARDNVLYVEGCHLDDFLQNKITLSEVVQNKIGVIIDRGAIEADPHSIDMAINTIESLRVIAGITVIGFKITDEPIGGHALKMPSGAFSGEVKNTDTLIKAAKELITAGATAIAIATHIDIDNIEADLSEYFKGNLANPFGGTEALISHTISKIFRIPVAHAPILPKWEKEYYDSVGVVDPRASSEVVSPAYLGCILRGLSKSPQVNSNDGIKLSDVKAIIVPYNSCGGIPMLMSQKYNIPLICVRENKTCLNVTPELMEFKNYIIAENYWEAIGIVAALKSGINIESLRRPFKSIKQIF